MRGYQAAAKYHSENTGLPYNSLKLKKDGDAVEVRVLQPEDSWVSLFMHSDFATKLKQTRCPSEEGRDIEACPLCAVDAPRSLRTFIPVRLRGEADETKVHVIEYGRDNLGEVISQIEELPAGTDITQFDFKVKRKGSGTDTTYKWIVQNAHEPEALSEAERALEVPDIDTLIAVPAPEVIADRAKVYRQAKTASPVADKTTSRSRF